MEPSQSHKRKRISQHSCSAFSGTFTRSKSQIYVHHNRSGRARTDASRKPVHCYYDLDRSVGEVREENREIPMKDLRLRRVFPSGPARSESPKGGGFGNGLDGFFGEEKSDNGLVSDFVSDGKSLSVGEKVDVLGDENVRDGEFGSDFGVGNEAQNDGNLVSDGKSLNGFGNRNVGEKVDVLGDGNEGDLVRDGKSLDGFEVGNEAQKDGVSDGKSLCDFGVGNEAQNEGNLVGDGKLLSDFGVGNEGEKVGMAEARNGESLVEKVVAFNEVEQTKGANLSNKVV